MRSQYPRHRPALEAAPLEDRCDQYALVPGHASTGHSNGRHPLGRGLPSTSPSRSSSSSSPDSWAAGRRTWEGVLVLRSEWFRGKARAWLVSSIETATGGRAEMGAFRFDFATLRVEADSFVLHGTEPRRAVRVENNRPAEAFGFHLFEIVRDGSLGDIAVEPPPIGAQPRLVRRI